MEADGKQRPNGAKILTLRKRQGLTQQALAERAGYSERLIREIERRNHPVPTTTITDLAAALKVNAGEIIHSAPDASSAKDGPTGSLLKLRAVHSATELSALAKRANRYEWELNIDPNIATAPAMQAVMKIVNRLIDSDNEPSGYEWQPGDGDEFDQQEFGVIPRLAHLQDLLTKLPGNGVNVIVGTHTRSHLRSLKEGGEFLGADEICVRGRGVNKRSLVIKTQLILLIHFVPSDVEEKVVPIVTGPSLENFERVPWEEVVPDRPGEIDDDIPF